MPVAKYRILVDFAQDGVWSTAINDISDDVRRFSWTKGKKVISQRAEAGTLDILVNNDDHKFSPSNPLSPLHPYVTIGPDVWASVGYPVDTFNAADATTLTSRAPDFDSLFDDWSGDTGDFDILSNKIRTQAAANKSATLDFGESDCWVAVDFTRNGPNSGLILRWQDANNYLLVRSDGNTLRLSTCTAGVLADVKTATHTWGAGDEKRISVELHGQAVRVYVDHTLLIETTSTFGQTETLHGIGGRATNTSDRWDNFGGWRDVFFGRLDSVMPKPLSSQRYAYIRAFDDMERLALHQIYRTAPDAPATAKDIIGEILDAADVSSSNRVLDTGATLTTDPAFEAVMGEDALEELYLVQDDDVGFFYIDGGINRYEGVDHRDSGPHSSPLKTWRADRVTDTEDDIIFQDVVWDDNKELIENEGYFRYFRYSLGNLAQVWALQTEGVAGERDRPAIGAETKLTFLALGQGDGIASPEIPFPNTRFQIWTNEDETGTNLTLAQDTEQGAVTASGAAAYTLDDAGQDFTDWNDGDHVVVITDAGGDKALGFIAATDPDGDGTKVDLKTTSGLGTAGYAYSESGFSEADVPLTYDVFQCWAELESGFEGNFRRVAVKNGSASTGFVTFLVLHALEITETVQVAARFEEASSQTDFGRRRIDHQTKHIDRFLVALDRVTERIQRRQALRIHLKPQMMNATRACLMQILHRSISDRIAIDYPDMGLTQDAFIENQKVEVTDGGKKVVCTWELTEDPRMRAGLSGDFFPDRKAASGGKAGIIGKLSGVGKNWETTSSPPNAFSFLTIMALSDIRDSKVYVLDSGQSDGTLVFFYQYDLIADTWTTLAAPAAASGSLGTPSGGLVRVGEKLVVTWKLANGDINGRLAIYDIASNTWSFSSQPSVAGWTDAPQVAGRAVPLVGGAAAETSDKVWVWLQYRADVDPDDAMVATYTLSTDTWDVSLAKVGSTFSAVTSWWENQNFYGADGSGNQTLHRYDVGGDSYSSTTLPAAPGSFTRSYTFYSPGCFGYIPVYGTDEDGNSDNTGAKIGFTFVGAAPTETDHLQVFDYLVITEGSNPGDEDDVIAIAFNEELTQIVAFLEDDSDWTPTRLTPYVYL